MTNYPDLNNLIYDIDSQLAGAVESTDSMSFEAAPEPVAKYILVEIGSRSLAVMIDSLAEVGPVPTITPLPHLPEWIKGIMNIRSEIVSMVDFVGFLGEEQVEARRGKKLLVLREKKMKVGIGADSIIRTVTRSASDIQPRKKSIESSIGTVLFPQELLVDGEVYAILDVQKFLTHPRLINFAQESLS